MNRYDIDFINPMGNPGTHYAFEAESEEQAREQSPHWLAASSQWRPDQFKVTAVRPSIYQKQEEV